jgi:hypothetical protein
MQRIIAIAWLTWKAALRFRLFLVIAVLLLAAVVGLPVMIKDDGTARGFTQILLTYTLSAITGLLGLSTLWLSCGTLARDIEECQIQVVATKPIARWQIWLGKWLGIVILNAALLAISGACVFGLLQWRAAHLPAAEQKILREQVLVARGLARPQSVDAQINAQTKQVLEERLKSSPDLAGSADLPEVEKQIREQVKAIYQIVPPGYSRQWRIDLSSQMNSLRDRPLQLRIKFNSAGGGTGRTFAGFWQVGDAQKMEPWQSESMSLSSDTFHEFQVPANLLDDKGVLAIAFLNPNDTSLLFPVEDGVEVLYPEGGLAAIGLMAASFLTFPVAAFFSMAVLAVVLSSGTLADTVASGSVGVGNDEKGIPGHSPADMVLIPVFKGILVIVNLAKGFSPIDSLSGGLAITWGELGAAFGQIVLLLGGIIGIIGIVLFSRRELATAQGNQ